MTCLLVPQGAVCEKSQDGVISNEPTLTKQGAIAPPEYPVEAKEEVVDFQRNLAALVFDAMDRDGNGRLSHREIKDYLHLPENQDKRALLAGPGKKWSDVWAAIDTDGDTELDKEVTTADASVAGHLLS